MHRYGPESFRDPYFERPYCTSSIATFVLQTSWVKIASLMYPVDKPGDPLTQIPWKCYNRFVESVKEVH